MKSNGHVSGREAIPQLSILLAGALVMVFAGMSEPVFGQARTSGGTRDGGVGGATPPRGGGFPGGERGDGERGGGRPGGWIKWIPWLPGLDPPGPKEADPAKQLAKNGPLFPKEFSLSDLKVAGFAKGGWQVVVEYELQQPAKVQFTALVDVNTVWATRLDLQDGGVLGRHAVVVNLPDTFPKKPVPASFQVTCTRVVNGNDQPEYIKIYGIGCGPNVYGSIATTGPPFRVASSALPAFVPHYLRGCEGEPDGDSLTVDQLTLSPPSINVKQGEKTDYRFHACRDFSNSGVEFYKFWREGRQIKSALVRSFKTGGRLKRNDWVGLPPKLQSWDGTDQKNKPSKGSHFMMIRVWTNPANDGSWLGILSDSSVEVAE